MSLATLQALLDPSLEEGSAVAGLVCLGWEDARAYVMAAEEESSFQNGNYCSFGKELDFPIKKDFPLREVSFSFPLIERLFFGFILKTNSC